MARDKKNKTTKRIFGKTSFFNGGVVKDIPDERDFLFGISPIFEAQRASLPRKVDWSNELSPIKYQGRKGACVAFSAVGLKEWHEQKEHLAEVADGKRDNRKGIPYFDLSEQWVYHNCKKIDGIPNTSGTYLRTALKVLHKIGVPTEAGWKYTDSPDIGKPESWSHMVAKWNRIGSYESINSLQELKSALCDSPVMMGMEVFEEMVKSRLVGGVVPMPNKSSRRFGGHAVLAVGFDDKTGLIKYKNSWSRFWGEAGYGYIHYDYYVRYVWSCWKANDISVTKEMLKGTTTL